VFTPVLAKHSKSFSLIDCISVGVHRMQRNFEPMRKQVEAWQKSELTDVTAKVVIYEAFVEGRLEAPKHLARTVHDLYFEPKYEEFPARTTGVFPMRSRRHSKNWIRFRSSRQKHEDSPREIGRGDRDLGAGILSERVYPCLGYTEARPFSRRPAGYVAVA
jgi:hypothetical protein